MAYEVPGFQDGVEVAAVDLDTKQFTAVTLTATGYAPVTNATTRVDGILQNKPKAGEACAVMKSGISKLVAGANFAKGASLMCDTAGRGILGATAGNIIWAVAREAAAAPNVIVSVEIGFLQRPL